MPVNKKRIYDEKNKDDGVRILVDRVWPRGMSKEEARIDHWIKEVGPSSELRKWFDHDPNKYDTFKQKYKEELKSGEQEKALQKIKDITKKHNKNITLVYASKEEKYNQASVLKEILDHQ